jgi:S1-C subfamily serine protease
MQGVLVLDVLAGSTADEMGIQPTRVNDDEIALGDIIVSLDGKPVDSLETLFSLLDEHELGDETTVRVIRGAGTKDAREVKLKGQLKREPARR